ncbi:MAG: hypothetical protein FXF47_09090 [Candidatus Mcinerneyibacterium aminivorans]|jgi:hypothetical protein|uniref:DUF6868 domain-containing protein n=1 Tax=Candidatus Mcinerneyibacterium aminivorans TaxID=2703815 RepID=A0A5D0MGU2_9BACT|nr:MAG: hypothetical protein FXF47_09090 [Candidatus Mcinerneyibacterium aminivorans]
MDIHFLKYFFMWCTIINFGLLFIALIPYMFFKNSIYKIFENLYGISRKHFELMYFYSLVFIKVLILVFNFTPFIALTIIY